MDRYPTPSNNQRFELQIKRSRFITSVGNVADKGAARLFIAALRTEFPDASHHCWAMVAGRPDDIYQHDQSDDGEPKGTAGKPMLNVLQHAGFGNTVVVVSRYFGGIKLGAGGLVRAYTQAVSEALTNTQTREAFIREQFVVELPYSMLDSLEHWLRTTNISVAQREFQESVVLTLLAPVSEAGSLKRRLSESGGGEITLRHVEAKPNGNPQSD